MGREGKLYKRRLLLLLLVVVVVVAVGELTQCADAAAATSMRSDVQALLAFKQAIVKDPFHALIGWSIAHINTTCHWQGVTCLPHSSHVSSISLPNLTLQGTASAPAALASLQALAYLDLSGNRFTGSIPASLANCSNLRLLDLSDNSFTGTIPAQLGMIPTLLHLILSTNSLTGPVPQTLGGLSSLQFLDLSYNELRDDMSKSMSSLANCSNLVVLNASRNYLHGRIPHTLGRLSKLEALWLRYNDLSGSIPESLANCSQLREVIFTSNQLSGRIPMEIGALTALQRLSPANNSMTGTIPNSIANCTALIILDFGYNFFTGQIPLELSALTALQWLSFYNNNMIGRIPEWIGNLSALTVLQFEQNSFSGPIPSELGKLQNVQQLTMFGNRLDGAIPASLGNCSGMINLKLAENNLTGNIPISISMLSNLQFLTLSDNRLTGGIPTEIGDLTQLLLLQLETNELSGIISSAFGNLSSINVIELSNNKLSGEIPSELRQCSKLYFLALYDNLLSGAIPSELGEMPSLRNLYMDNNHLTGPIPNSLGNLHTLEDLFLSGNLLTGSIPASLGSLQNLELGLDLSHNLLTGPIPEGLGGFQMLQEMDLSSNLLSGRIPKALGDCPALEVLDLSHNKLMNSIPEDLGSLISLVSLDLSVNNLSGPIPEALTRLHLLKFLNLSHNNLSGTVPSEGPFRNFTAATYYANPGLCGAILRELCPTAASKSQSRVIIICIVLGAVAASIFAMSFMFWLFSNACATFKVTKARLGVVHNFPHREVDLKSEADVLAATDNFKEENILGRGSVGIVYKGTAREGRVVAIKRMTVDSKGSFARECLTLGKIRHRNLIKILSCVSGPNVKALVLEFMANGSLEKNLYELGDVCPMSWALRFQIALDVAHALAYLHHESGATTGHHIVHCDVKPSNILLDENFVAHVGDFGIARLIDPAMERSSTVLEGTIGYLAPECAYMATVSTKGDVYSYGVVLLEMLTRIQPRDEHSSCHGLTLPKWVQSAFPDKAIELMDGSLQQELIMAQDSALQRKVMLAVMALALRCTQDAREDRPSMQEVVRILEELKGPRPNFQHRSNIIPLLQLAHQLDTSSS